jgi:hypothetical protein
MWALTGTYASSPSNGNVLAYNGTLTAGSLLVCYPSTFGGSVATNVTDSIGNTWHQAGTEFYEDFATTDGGNFWYTINSTATTNTVTAVSLSGEFYGLSLAEFTGNSSVIGSVLNAVETYPNQTGTTMNAAVTSTVANCLIIGVFYPTDSTSYSAPWLGNATITARGGIIYQAVTTATTYTPTMTQGSGGGSYYGSLGAAFAPAVTTNASAQQAVFMLMS